MINPKLLPVYSTTEQVVGTWFGKPIYRKVFVVNKSETTSSSINIPTNIETVETVVNQRGFVERTDGYIDYIPTNITNTDFMTYFGDFSTNLIRVRMGNSIYSVMSKVTVILEYTKTTD